MSVRKMHEIRIEQYDTAQGIKQHYGLKAAFDYLVAEKLLNFAEAAAEHPEFALGLPWFVSQVRLMFMPLGIKTHIARVERELHDKNLPAEDEDDLIRKRSTTIAKRARQFASIKELLAATEFGTS